MPRGGASFLNGGAGDDTERAGQCADSGIGGFGGGGNGGNGGGGGGDGGNGGGGGGNGGNGGGGGGGYAGGDGGGSIGGGGASGAAGKGGESYNAGTNPEAEDGANAAEGAVRILLAPLEQLFRPADGQRSPVVPASAELERVDLLTACLSPKANSSWLPSPGPPSTSNCSMSPRIGSPG